MDKLLYFPNITIPKTPWLYRSLLYWDQIETITPEEYLKKPDELYSPHMKELLITELVKPVIPSQYTPRLFQFKKAFLEHVDSNYSPSHVVESEKEPVGFSKIHDQKLNSIGEELVLRGFASRSNDGWYYVYQPIAKQFMFSLATIIGNERNSHPITDKVTYIITSPLQGNEGQTKQPHQNILRDTILSDIFPIPQEINNFQDIYEFKTRNETQLKKFRRYIEGKLLDIDCASEENKQEKIKYLIRDIEEEKNSIASKMESKWGSLTTGSLLSFTLGAGGLSVSIVDHLNNNSNLGALGTGTSLLAFLVSALSKNRRNTLNVLRRPLAYAYLVDKNFKI